VVRFSFTTVIIMQFLTAPSLMKRLCLLACISWATPVVAMTDSERAEGYNRRGKTNKFIVSSVCVKSESRLPFGLLHFLQVMFGRSTEPSLIRRAGDGISFIGSHKSNTWRTGKRSSMDGCKSCKQPW
jgi:hypothetical protein